ncbi:unnamed protein product [Cuscuta epithymum]|uniref:BHLH domain-containing protein n=1 Tax=Cuscuta epithymum TaxID=186058 RepID=A0AAV0CG67_9ASTE|nr:unnamed protein product [Cuscuta epithymum]
MALSQFVKFNQLDFAEQKATSSSADRSSLQESAIEIVPENGRIVVQGQSAKAKSGAAASYILSSKTPMNRENFKGNSSSPRTGRIFLMDSTLDEIGRLDYSLNDSLQQDLSSVLVPEVTGLAANELPAQNNRTCGSNQMAQRSVSKVDSWSYAKAYRPVVRPLVSGNSDIMVSHASNNIDSVLLDSLPGEASAGIRMQNPERSDPSLLNFSHFTRPVKSRENKEKVMNVNWICLANVAAAETCSTSKKETCLLNQLKLRHAKIQATAKTHNDVFPIKEPNTSFRDGVMNNHNPYGVLGRDRAIEAGAACSSMCSGNSPKKNSNDRSNLLKRKFHEDIEDECTSVNTMAPGRGGTGLKRSREHNFSDRREKIDEKMLALQDLIPNCNKMDKASMLDEAIEYLKTLQLQLQIMSMGTGFCMPQMMYPVGMPASQMQHFPLFGLGMGMTMGFGMRMQSMNGVSPVCPFPIPHMQQAQMSPSPFSGPGDCPSFGHPPSSSPTTFPPIVASNFPTFGHPGLCPRIPTTEAPTIPPPATNSVVGMSASKMETRVEVPCASITKMQ